jgi:hypothetical protein
MASINRTSLLITILKFQQNAGVLDLGQDTVGLISEVHRDTRSVNCQQEHSVSPRSTYKSAKRSGKRKYPPGY